MFGSKVARFASVFFFLLDHLHKHCLEFVEIYRSNLHLSYLGHLSISINLFIAPSFRPIIISYLFSSTSIVPRLSFCRSLYVSLHTFSLIVLDSLSNSVHAQYHALAAKGLSQTYFCFLE